MQIRPSPFKSLARKALVKAYDHLDDEEVRQLTSALHDARARLSHMQRGERTYGSTPADQAAEQVDLQEEALQEEYIEYLERDYTLAVQRANSRQKALRYRVKGDEGSYFGNCERDEQGHCLPSGQSSGGGTERPKQTRKDKRNALKKRKQEGKKKHKEKVKRTKEQVETIKKTVSSFVSKTKDAFKKVMEKVKNTEDKAGAAIVAADIAATEMVGKLLPGVPKLARTAMIRTVKAEAKLRFDKLMKAGEFDKVMTDIMALDGPLFTRVVLGLLPVASKYGYKLIKKAVGKKAEGEQKPEEGKKGEKAYRTDAERAVMLQDTPITEVLDAVLADPAAGKPMLPYLRRRIDGLYHAELERAAARLGTEAEPTAIWDAITARVKSVRIYPRKSEGTCKPGERSDLTGCTPAGGGGGKKPDEKLESKEAQQSSQLRDLAASAFNALTILKAKRPDLAAKMEQKGKRSRKRMRAAIGAAKQGGKQALEKLNYTIYSVQTALERIAKNVLGRVTGMSPETQDRVIETATDTINEILLGEDMDVPDDPTGLGLNILYNFVPDGVAYLYRLGRIALTGVDPRTIKRGKDLASDLDLEELTDILMELGEQLKGNGFTVNLDRQAIYDSLKSKLESEQGDVGTKAMSWLATNNGGALVGAPPPTKTSSLFRNRKALADPIVEPSPFHPDVKAAAVAELLGGAASKSFFRNSNLIKSIKAFTGEKPDKLGRRICYEEGKRVPCPDKDGDGKVSKEKKDKPKQAKTESTSVGSGEDGSAADKTRTAKAKASRMAKAVVLKSSKITVTRQLGGGSNASFVVTFEDGSHGVFKPAMGEHADLVKMVGGPLYQREAAASVLSETLGFGDLVPPTRQRAEPDKTGKMHEASVQAFQGDAVTAFQADNEWGSSEEDVSRAGCLDFVMNNLDRRSCNWMVSNAGKLRLIDNGMCFPEKWAATVIGADLVAQCVETDAVIPPSVKAWGDKEFAAAKKSIMGQGISERAADMAVERMKLLAMPEAKTFKDLARYVVANFKELVNKFS